LALRAAFSAKTAWPAVLWKCWSSIEHGCGSPTTEAAGYPEIRVERVVLQVFGELRHHLPSVATVLVKVKERFQRASFLIQAFSVSQKIFVV